MDYEKLLLDAMKDGIKSGMKEAFGGYNSAGQKLIQKTVESNAGLLNDLVAEAMLEAIRDPDFRVEFKTAMRTTLAKQLVQKFGGELEKAVNRLKSDPITRAKITAAIDNIIKEPTAA